MKPSECVSRDALEMTVNSHECGPSGVKQTYYVTLALHLSEPCLRNEDVRGELVHHMGSWMIMLQDHF